MAFRKKWHLMLALKPDILIIQECEHESKYKEAQLIPGYNQFIWIGDNINKGVGIITFNNYHIKLLDVYSEDFKYVIPIQVTGDNAFNLFAIWAMPDKKKANSYIGQVWRAIEYYKDLLDSPSILIGDWNSNAIWDKERIGNHSQTVSKLNGQNIFSIYHQLKQEAHGQEKEATLYLLKKKDRPYHIDYCFLSKQLFGSDLSIEVGLYKNWIKYSDHMPLIIDAVIQS